MTKKTVKKKAEKKPSIEQRVLLLESIAARTCVYLAMVDAEIDKLRPKKKTTKKKKS